MKLTAYEQALLDGKHGQAKQIAMRVVCKMGELYHAHELIPVSRAHIDGCSYSAVWDAGLEFAELLTQLGGKVAVPTSLNIASRDGFNGVEVFRNPADFNEKCRRMEDAYYAMGCIPSWTCASYQYCNAPAFGEHVAFAESNVVNYANSVLGARTERYGDLIDICCALVGRVPAMGLHLTENRYATKIYDVSALRSARLDDTSGFAALGYLIGSTTGSQVPVVNGLFRRATHEDLKALSAASAASGSVGLFHVVGSTPEAPTLEAATGGRMVDDVMVVTDELLEQAFQGLTNARKPIGDGHVDLVIMGCPHLSFSEASRVMEYLGDRRKADGTEFWLQTNDAVWHMLERVGLLKRAHAAGIKIMRDSCIMNQPMTMWGLRRVVVNSGKMAHYGPGNLDCDVFFRDMKTCVEIAVRGRLEDLA